MKSRIVRKFLELEDLIQNTMERKCKHKIRINCFFKCNICKLIFTCKECHDENIIKTNK
jgi:hypothetical protein